MIKFLAGLAVTVATVIVVLRLIGAAETAAITPVDEVGSSSITVVDPCQTGERAVVRALPDGSIEGVQCR